MRVRLDQVLLMLAACVLAAAPLRAEAHALVREANIADGATFELSPFSFVIEFRRAVALAEIVMVDQDGKSIPIPVVGGVRAIHNVSLPVLPPHGYRLFWRTADPRGGARGSVGFTVLGCDDPARVPAHGNGATR